MHHLSLKIVLNRPISEDFYEMAFEWESPLEIPLPGQFLTIRVSDSTVPLLRRPFAFSNYNASDGLASIIFKRIGTATRTLAGKAAGDKIDIIGPLGKPFPEAVPSAISVIVAGGIGIGPMTFWGNYLLGKKRDVRFVFGCKDGSSIPKSDVFDRLSPAICTDNGSAGFHGTCVDYLCSEKFINREKTVLYGCGPTSMLKAMHMLAAERGYECYVSMEQVMACGVGACMGCVVKTVRDPGYVRVCRDGPVFNSKDILWT